MKIFLLGILFTSYLFAQNTPDDRELVKTTFQRTFNKSIILEYLNSGDHKKVNAALLSISQSEDTSFVNDIINLDYNNYEEYICFALGQLGNCKQSQNYLFNKISDNPPKYLLEAIGKVSDSEFAEVVLDKLKDLGDYSLTVYHLFNTGSISKENAQQILKEQIAKNPNKENSFAYYRIGPDEDSKELLVDVLRKTDSPEIKANILGCLRKLKFFPDDQNFFDNSISDLKKLSATKLFLSIEYLKTLCYYNFSSTEELNSYLSFLLDNNPNISRQAAISLSEINISEKLKPYLQNEIRKAILSPDKTENTKGELFLTYQKLFPDDFNNSIDELKKYVRPDFVYRAYGNMVEDESALNYLMNSYESENEKNKMLILSSLLNFQEHFSDSERLNEFFLNTLVSNSAPIISITADGVDSVFVAKHSDQLKEIVNNQIEKYKDNADFIEAVMSLVNLSEKINKSFYDNVVEQLKTTELYSIRKFISNKEGISFSEPKDTSMFNIFWENAFKYKSAEVTTTTGTFTIGFLTQFAPISVGNFCYLASKGFYNEIEFHRVVPGFVIQAGDPTGTGWGGPGYEIVSEFSTLQFNRGYVGMASAGKDTEGSQWFVMQGDYPHLNGRYTVFGSVNRNSEIYYNTEQGDKIISIKLIEY